MGRVRRGSVPLLGTGVAFGLLLAALSVGIRVSDLGLLPSAPRTSRLDYSGSPAGRFPPLDSDFIRGALGSLIPVADLSGDGEQPRLAGGRFDGSAAAPDPRRVPPLSNDDFGRASGIERVPFTAESQTAGATRQAGEPRGCGTVEGGTVWFRYVAPQDLGLIADTFGTSYATALTVYEGSRFGALRPIGECDEDLKGNSRVAFKTKSLTAYVFQVGAALLDGGLLRFRLTREGITSVVSLDSSGKTGANHQSFNTSISADGRYVAFDSGATNLVEGVRYPCPLTDYVFCANVYVRDRLTGRNSLVSVSPSGEEAGDYWSQYPSISADGRFVAFMSAATNLVPGEPSLCVRPAQYLRDGIQTEPHGPICRQVYVRDLATGTTTLISSSMSGTAGNGDSERPSVSADGRFVSFESRATDLVEQAPQLCSSSLYTVPVPPRNPPGLCTQVFVRDRVAGTTIRVSVSSTGEPAGAGSFESSISADGRFVAFTSWARNLVPGRTAASCVASRLRSLSAETDSTCANVYVRDLLMRRTEIVSVSTEGAPGAGDSSATGRFISADGRYVAFASFAPNLDADDADSDTPVDVFVHDRVTRSTERVSVPYRDEQPNDNADFRVSISADGGYVVYSSLASNLVPGDTNACAVNIHFFDFRSDRGKCRDVFLFDRRTRTTTRVSVSSLGDQGELESTYPDISANGRWIVFPSAAQNLVRGYKCGTGTSVPSTYWHLNDELGHPSPIRCFGIFIHEQPGSS